MFAKAYLPPNGARRWSSGRPGSPPAEWVARPQLGQACTGDVGCNGGGDPVRMEWPLGKAMGKAFSRIGEQGIHAKTGIVTPSNEAPRSVSVPS